MVDRVIGCLALAVLVAFLAVIVGFVPEPALAVVMLVVAALAAYDFYGALFRKSGDDR
jgi:hypothetical protein